MPVFKAFRKRDKRLGSETLLFCDSLNMEVLMKINSCPGAANIKGTPTLKIKQCPQCGNEIEIFSSDIQSTCENCGFIAYNDIMSCIKWCKSAKECVGEETFLRLTQNGESK